MKRMISMVLLLVISLTMGIVVPAAAATYSARTTIYDATSALTNNIDLALAALDGVEVWSDEIFSFNDVVGDRTTDEGYQSAINGRGVRAVGGGVSQVATTLYLALKKRGGVDYVEKTAYGNKFTGQYVSSGSDAIVTDSSNDNDFSFLNTGDTFTISLYRSGSTVYCTLSTSEDWDEGDDWSETIDDYGSGDYLFPNSDWKKLTRSQVLALPESEWGYARNEIYARHGYQFNTAKYRRYFEAQDWYRPGGFSTRNVNEIEWYNMALIKSLEEEYGASSSGTSSGASSSSYIFPDSSRKRLTRRDILAVSKSQWGYARNEIYARHGYRFQTKKYADYFAKKRWYTPGGFNTKDLNQTEWDNMDLIKSMEDEYGVS